MTHIFTFTYLLTYLVIYSLTHSATHPLTHLLTYLLTYRLLEYCDQGVTKLAHAVFRCCVDWGGGANFKVLPMIVTNCCVPGAYFCMNMILITLSMFLAVVIIQTHIRGDRKNRVPPWLRRVSNPAFSLAVPVCRVSALWPAPSYTA